MTNETFESFNLVGGEGLQAVAKTDEPQTPLTPRRDATERFWARVQKSAGCWLWTGAKTDMGYGGIKVGRKVVGPHRYSWEIHNRPIPDGLQVNHRCDVRHCVRPDHLYLGTQKENVADMDNRRRRALHYKPRNQVRGPIPDGLHVLHRCDNPPCVRPDHLFLGTQADNMADCKSKGRTSHGESHSLIAKQSVARGDQHWCRRKPWSIPRGDDHWKHKHPDSFAKGSAHGRSKLKEADVLTIRKMKAETGLSNEDIGKRFGVRGSMISRIVNRQNWKHI